jgi:hypothetical protein
MVIDDFSEFFLVLAGYRGVLILGVLGLDWPVEWDLYGCVCMGFGCSVCPVRVLVNVRLDIWPVRFMD